MNHQDFFCDFLSIFADPSKRIWSKVTQNVKFPQKTQSKVIQKQVCIPFLDGTIAKNSISCSYF